MAKLVVKSGRNAGTEYKLEAGRVLLGRRAACHVPLADLKASREHAVIFTKDGEFYLRDLSRNGTFLNGQPASQDESGTVLKIGDEIQIGDTLIMVINEKSEVAHLEIPGYDIQEKVGSGGMGAVFKARQLSMDRIVAMKVLSERYAGNAEFVERFIREARAAGKLNHPNVIHVHDISCVNGRHYFSMEFVDGGSLKEMLRLERKLEVRRALDIVLQTARALEFAHENGIVHRDIKPDNIMLTREGIVKLADLGIAKTFEELPPEAKEQHRVLGTPHYMAPEQALGKEIDHRADIYSLGATFYHTLAGCTPFSGSTAHQILKAHIQESVPSLQNLNPYVPDSICFIIERMMAKIPDKRYPDMARLIQDLERVQKELAQSGERLEPAPVRQPSDNDENPHGARTSATEEVTTRQQAVRRLGLLLAGAAAVVAVGLAGLLLFTDNKEALAPVHKPPAPEPPKHGVNVRPNGGPRENPEAKKLLEQARLALEREDLAAGEQLLVRLRERFAASEEAEEAARLLVQLNATRQENEERRARELLAQARKYEADNLGDLAACLENYRKVIESTRAHPAVQEEAKSLAAKLEERIAAQRAAAQQAAYNQALQNARAAQTQGDYDAARAAWEEYLAQNQDEPLASAGREALAQLNAAAEERFNQAMEAAAKLEPAAALALWDDYERDVKNSAKITAVAGERETVQLRAVGLVQEELVKCAELAHKLDLAAALAGAKALERAVSGMPPAEAVQARIQTLSLQKDLFDRATSELRKKIAAGPLPIPFEIKTKFGKVNWRATKLTGTTLQLAADGFGIPLRLPDLSPKEQYDLLCLALGPDPGTAGHEGLAAFCAERGLELEAEAHRRKALLP